MVDTDRQLPSLSASAWSIDLAASGGPVFVVHRLGKADARAALIAHLVEIGSFPSEAGAEAIVAEAPAESVAVIW